MIFYTQDVFKIGECHMLKIEITRFIIFYFPCFSSLRNWFVDSWEERRLKAKRLLDATFAVLVHINDFEKSTDWSALNRSGENCVFESIADQMGAMRGTHGQHCVSLHILRSSYSTWMLALSAFIRTSCICAFAFVYLYWCVCIDWDGTVQIYKRVKNH